MNTSTLNLTTISLQASVSSPDQIISISGGIFLSEPASSLNVTLIEYDLNLLKFSNQLATNSQNTFLSTLDNTVRDMNGIPMSPISRNAAVKVTQYISDTTKPFVQFAMFDMNSSVITLGFSETVIYNQIYPSFLTILSIFRVIDNTTVDRFTLTSGIVSQINSSVVRIRIDVSDLDIIKGLSIVNMTGGPPLLSFPSEFAFDTSNNSINQINISSARQFDVLVRDQINPKLVSFATLNLDSNLVELSFSESVNLKSIQIEELKLSNFFGPSPGVTLSFVNLTNGTVLSTGITNSVVISISTDDINNIKANPSICSQKSSCYVRIGEDFLTDFAGNPLEPVLDSTSGFIVDNYIGDSAQYP